VPYLRFLFTDCSTSKLRFSLVERNVFSILGYNCMVLNGVIISGAETGFL
jgi:hypothetical protein